METENIKYEELRSRFPTVKWGIEMEWEGHAGLSLPGYNAAARDKGLNLQLGTDHSVIGAGGPRTRKSKSRLNISGKGYELRTNLPWQVFPAQEIRHGLTVIHENGWINRRCGLHIHESGIPLTAEELRMFRHLLQKQAGGIWKARAHYCPFRPDACPTEVFSNEHHAAVPVRKMSSPAQHSPTQGQWDEFGGWTTWLTSGMPATADHIEIRIFNMSSNFRGIHQAWVRVVNLLHQIKITPRASELTL